MIVASKWSELASWNLVKCLVLERIWPLFCTNFTLIPISHFRISMFFQWGSITNVVKLPILANFGVTGPTDFTVTDPKFSENGRIHEFGCDSRPDSATLPSQISWIVTGDVAWGNYNQFLPQKSREFGTDCANHQKSDTFLMFGGTLKGAVGWYDATLVPKCVCAMKIDLILLNHATKLGLIATKRGKIPFLVQIWKIFH